MPVVEVGGSFATLLPTYETVWMRDRDEQEEEEGEDKVEQEKEGRKKRRKKERKKERKENKFAFMSTVYFVLS